MRTEIEKETVQHSVPTVQLIASRKRWSAQGIYGCDALHLSSSLLHSRAMPGPVQMVCRPRQFWVVWIVHFSRVHSTPLLVAVKK